MKTGRRIRLGKRGRQMRETATGMAAAANVPAILRPHRPASKEGAAPPPVTAGSQERGHDQGTVRAAGGLRTGRAKGAGSAAPRLSTETHETGRAIVKTVLHHLGAGDAMDSC